MRRLVRLSISLNILFALVVLRLIYLQLINGPYYRGLADRNRIRVVPEYAPRGLITDRRGLVLADSRIVFRVAIIPQELKEPTLVLQRIGEITNSRVDALNLALSRERSLAFVPATIISRVPKDVALHLEEERLRLPGLLVRSDSVRHYPMGPVASHLLGYLGQPTSEELPLLKQYGVRPRELIGRMGLEQALDHALRGKSGGTLIEVDHNARQVRVIGYKAPEPGSAVKLTIDAQLQSLIADSFGSQPGACVVLEPATGAVLAMVSVPAFNPEAFSASDTGNVLKFLNDPQSPLMNRATVGAYQPGSIMKLITAAAALKHRIITPTSSITCNGSLKIGDRVFHCWNRDGHRSLTLSEALMQSCNVYFMHLGQRLGIVRLRQAMDAIGLSHKTGWPLEEQPGHLPNRRLTEGEIALLAIGQGEILITPLQAALMASVFANGGWFVEPWVVNSVGETKVTARTLRRELDWPRAAIDAVRDGMVLVVRDEHGTGHRAFSTLVSIAGKTGTAQTHVPGMSHGWFVGFCPVEKPRIAMAVVVEHGGSGGDMPAEIAKTICEYTSAPGTL